mmetsp:Transcript_22725/g.47259  ORF Transcript_22725/g.47259 Transcript_22725/m.47259 type:complete len:132 (+) Transcript_22725:73-468(+)
MELGKTYNCCEGAFRVVAIVLLHNSPCSFLEHGNENKSFPRRSTTAHLHKDSCSNVIDSTRSTTFFSLLNIITEIALHDNNNSIKPNTRLDWPGVYLDNITRYKRNICTVAQNNDAYECILNRYSMHENNT